MLKGLNMTRPETYGKINEYNNLARFTYNFNELASGADKLTFTDLANQFKLIDEETEEIFQGLDNHNPEEVLDGAVDVIVVTMGLLQKLQNLGFDVDRAMQKTGMNNITKFPTTLEVVDASVKMYADQGIKVTPVFNHKFDRWALIDEAGKVRKPAGYVKNDLRDCIPEGFTL